MFEVQEETIPFDRYMHMQIMTPRGIFEVPTAIDALSRISVENHAYAAIFNDL
jgi:hypothetical protein